MRILVVVTFGGLSFWLTPLPVLLIKKTDPIALALRVLSILSHFIPG